MRRVFFPCFLRILVDNDTDSDVCRDEGGADRDGDEVCRCGSGWVDGVVRDEVW